MPVDGVDRRRRGRTDRSSPERSERDCYRSGVPSRIEVATRSDISEVIASADALVATDAGRYDPTATDLNWAALSVRFSHPRVVSAAIRGMGNRCSRHWRGGTLARPDH
jgi:hypothetical protein